MHYLEFCRTILELNDPWQVSSVMLDQQSRRLDINVGFGISKSTKKNLFGIVGKKGLLKTREKIVCPRCHSVLPKHGETDTVCLRHLPIAGMRTYLHVPAPGAVQSTQSDCFCMKKWAAFDTRFTEVMYEHIINIISSIANDRSAARLSDITESEILEIRKATGIIQPTSTREGISYTLETQATARNDTRVDALFTIPEETHPAWFLLINGELPLRTDSMALRMLLQRLRVDLENEFDDEKRLKGVRTLRSFFLKNQKLLVQEIDLINDQRLVENDQSSLTTRSKPGLPVTTAKIWQQLINGEIEIQTDTVGLKMLLSRIRQLVTRNPTEANRLESARTLHQYFLKNRYRLTSELKELTELEKERPQQLMVGDTQGGIVPSIAHPGWQRLIDGELQFPTQTVALNMMLERIRRYLENNPGDSTRLACTKLLRHYFIKHQSKHKEELELLRAS